VPGRGKPYLQIEHLIEIAIVQPSIPSDGDRVSAHHARNGERIKRLGQSFHVLFVVARSQQKLQKSADGHVRDAEEVIELDAKLLIEGASKVSRQRARRRERPMVRTKLTKPLGMP
jgi:hypothetical protein